MDTNAILKRADELFDDDRAQEAGAYLEKMAEQAVSEDRYGTAMSLFNELTGYYRNTGNLDAAWRCVDEIVRLIDLLDLWGTADAATAMLNIATVYKAAGDPAAALAIYKKCEPVFISENVGDRRLAGLYNNICATALETGRRDDALYYAEKAWRIAERVHMDGEGLEIVRKNYNAAKQAAVNV